MVPSEQCVQVNIFLNLSSDINVFRYFNIGTNNLVPSNFLAKTKFIQNCTKLLFTGAVQAAGTSYQIWWSEVNRRHAVSRIINQSKQVQKCRRAVLAVEPQALTAVPLGLGRHFGGRRATGREN
ncbi:unnamed protein product, partial [Nesidiocoris tenuis]